MTPVVTRNLLARVECPTTAFPALPEYSAHRLSVRVSSGVHRPDCGTLTDASFRSRRTPTTKTRLCRLSIRQRHIRGPGWPSQVVAPGPLQVEQPRQILGTGYPRDRAAGVALAMPRGGDRSPEPSRSCEPIAAAARSKSPRPALR